MRPKEYDLPEACRHTGRSYNVIYRLVMLGTLRSVRRGGRWFLNAADVERLAHQNDVAASEAPEASTSNA